MQMSRRLFAAGLLLSGGFVAREYLLPSATAAAYRLQVFKSPYCGCCGAWVAHMRAAGFEALVIDLEDLEPVKVRYGVAPDLQSCHTALVESYVIEGHVPAEDVLRLLSERPAATGLAVPGMPIGSPGMEQAGKREPFDTLLFSASDRIIFARH